VGIEFGGASTVRPPFHSVLHRMQPGGVPTEELLDRVEYAAKVGASRLWLCGGEPAEHAGFLRVLEDAHRRGLRSGMQTMAHPFADPRLASEARRLGLDHATVLVIGGDAERHEALCGAGTWTRFALGMESLREAGVHRSAHLVISPGDERAIDACAARLRAADIAIDETTRLP
jgi:MoaA/NifB/PqqE/SkfB family radical SAM enzyme